MGTYMEINLTTNIVTMCGVIENILFIWKMRGIAIIAIAMIARLMHRIVIISAAHTLTNAITVKIRCAIF